MTTFHRRLQALLLAATAGLVAIGAPTRAEAQGARAPSLLITSQELQRLLGANDLVLLQVGTKEDYDTGHIPGARLVDFTALAAPRVEGEPMLELPAPDALKSAVEALGISDNSKIVVISGEDWGSPATRVIFTLQLAGLGDRTQLLDGGSRRWKAAGFAMSTGTPAPPRAGHLTRAQDRSLVVDFAWLSRSLPPRGFTLVDARAPIFYEGAGMNDGRGMKHDAGHVPGAHNLPFNTLFDDNVHLFSREELRQKFTAAGINPGDSIVVYCHIGQQATMVFFAARLLGHPVRLYDGSFTDWEAHNGPIENATKPAAARPE